MAEFTFKILKQRLDFSGHTLDELAAIMTSRGYGGGEQSVRNAMGNDDRPGRRKERAEIDVLTRRWVKETLERVKEQVAADMMTFGQPTNDLEILRVEGRRVPVLQDGVYVGMWDLDQNRMIPEEVL